MRCVDISRDMAGFNEVERLQISAFPPEESYPMDQILELVRRDNVEYKSFWEGEDLCGLMLYAAVDTMAYLFYLAVGEAVRSRGFGTQLLAWLAGECAGRAVVANIEVVGTGAANEEQRVRRLAFYTRNGYALADCRLLDDSGLYDIVTTSPGDFDWEEYLELIGSLGFDAYHPRLVSR